jgi:hypothetical protein
MHTGFEEFQGWAPKVLPELVSDKAHTGKYSIRVDPQHQYSPTFRAELGQLCLHHRPRRLTLSAWVWVPEANAEAALILAISNPEDPDHPVVRKSLFVSDFGPYGQWKYVSRDIDLVGADIPAFSSKSQLVIYLWNSSSNDPVYADDLRLTELW